MPSYLCRRLLALLTPCRGRDRERDAEETKMWLLPGSKAKPIKAAYLGRPHLANAVLVRLGWRRTCMNRRGNETD